MTDNPYEPPQEQGRKAHNLPLSIRAKRWAFYLVGGGVLAGGVFGLIESLVLSPARSMDHPGPLTTTELIIDCLSLMASWGGCCGVIALLAVLPFCSVLKHKPKRYSKKD